MGARLEMGFQLDAELRRHVVVDVIGDLLHNFNAADFNHSHGTPEFTKSYSPLSLSLPRSYLFILVLARDPTAIEPRSQRVSHLQTCTQQSRFHISGCNP